MSPLRMEDLCAACLCSGRTLHYLGETSSSSIYWDILNEIPIHVSESKLCVRICWECHAVLRNFENFKQQVKACYMEMLQFIHQGGQDAKFLLKPSRLQTELVISIEYPDIKTEFDSLAIGTDYPELSDQPLAESCLGQFDQTFDQPFDLQSPVNDDTDSLVKEEDHCEPETFVNDLDVNEKKEVRKQKKNVKVKKVKAPKEKKKKKTKKSNKVKKKPKIKDVIKSDACDVDDLLDVKLDVKAQIENDEKETECDIYNKSEIEDSKTEDELPLRNGAVKRMPRKPQKDSSEKPQCAECGKIFSSRKTLRYHLNVLHKGNNRYPCPRCGKVYQWKSNLGRHMRSHKARDTGELYCETCDKRFASVATYRQHLSISKQHVSESEFTFSCSDCGKKFVNKTRLRDHIDWEHLQKIKFRCQLCNKPFKCHTSLYVHMKNVHRNKGLKDNLCHVCGKSYQNRAKLSYHIVAMHTSETPYQCAQCSAAFGWYSSLYRHVREVHYKMKVHPSKSKKTKKRPLETLTTMLPPQHAGLAPMPPPDGLMS